MSLSTLSTYRNKSSTAGHRTALVGLLGIFCITLYGTAHAEPFEEQLQGLQQGWANANFNLSGKQQRDAFSHLLDDARRIDLVHQDDAEAAAWHGLIARSYLDTKGLFRRKSLARESRDALLRAEMQGVGEVAGMTYANLGALYVKMPGGIAGFGDQGKAISYFWKAISVDPNGLESNYLYAQYLMGEKKYLAARTALLKAQRAAAEANVSSTEAGRQKQLALMLDVIDAKIGRRGALLVTNFHDAAD